MAKRKVYGYWDCEYCGTKGIRGDHRECTQCGQPRSAGVHFYIKDSKNPEVIEQENLHKFSGKADWVCSYCNALNSDNSAICIGCGASKEDSERNYFSAHKATDTFDKKQGVWVTDEDRQTSQMYSRNSYADIKGPVRDSITDNWRRAIVLRIFLFGAIGLALIFLCALIYDKATTKQISVSNLLWQTEVRTEESYEAFESNWSLPKNARLAYTREEDCTYYVNAKRVVKPNKQYNADRIQLLAENRVADGEMQPLCNTVTVTTDKNVSIGLYDSDVYQQHLVPLDFEDNGDGSFDWDDGGNSNDSWDSYGDSDGNGHWVTEKRTKYYYYIERWRTKNVYTTGGTFLEPITYADNFELASDERIGGKTVTYIVITDDGTYNTTEEIWRKLEIGGKFKIKTGIFSEDTVIREIVN